MEVISVKYSTWKSVVNAKGWDTFHKVVTSGSECLIYAGTIEFLLESWVTGADYTDWNSTFGGDSTEVDSLEESKAQIIISHDSVFGNPRSFDGSPIAAQQPLSLGVKSFTRIDDGSELMSINGAAAGSDVSIWDGTGIDDTGADWSVSGTGSETTDSKKNGTNGWDTGVVSAGNFTVFNNGSMIDVNGSYSEVGFWVQIKAFPPGSKCYIKWLNGSDSQVGNTLKLSDYLDNLNPDEWKYISIPIADFNLPGNVQKLKFDYSKTGIRLWYDDLIFKTISGGGPYSFSIEAPDANTRYHMSCVSLLISSPEGGWNRDSFADISGGLINGLLFRHRNKSTGEIYFNVISKSNLQLFGQYDPQDSFVFSDGELLIDFTLLPEKASCIVTDNIILEFVVRDNLSTIGEMKAFCRYGKEVSS